MKKIFTIRLTDEVYEKLVKLAEKEDRSMNAQIIQLIKKAK